MPDINGVVKDGIFTVSIDKAAFMAEVQEVIDLAPIMQEIKDVIHLKWPSAMVPPALFTTINEVYDVVEVVAAAVEVVKQKYISLAGEMLPEGVSIAKFDKELALTTAVELLDAAIKFDGPVGFLVEKVDKAVLMVVVSVVVLGKAKNWLEEAKNILGMILS